MKTKIFTLLFALIVSNSIMFGARQIDGIWYSLDVASYTARVTYISSTKYEGNVIIPASVEYETNTYTVTCIGPNAFKDCTGLTSVTIPNSVTEIRSDAFNGCTSLTSVTIPNSVTKIGGLAFADCSGLISVSIGSGVSSISSSAFNPCTSLSTVMLNSDTIVGADYNLLISTTIQNIFGSQVTAYIIGDSVTSIGMMAFYGCNGLSSVIIGNRVASIGYSAFTDCTSLTSVTISSSVKSIKQRAFHNCTSLNSIICEAVTPPYLEWDSKYNIGVFTGVDKSIPLYVQGKSIGLYRTANQWKDFLNILPIPGTEIPCETYEFITDTMVYVGDEVMWHDGYVKAEKVGTYHYVDTLKTYLGCDSVFVLNLEVKPISQKMCSWLVESNDLEMGAIITNFTEPFYKYGTQITVEASPNSGYKFVKWNDGKKYNPYKFSLLDDKYLLAIFMEEQEEQDTTTVQPSSNSATFTWPFIVGGFSYSLTIYLDVACTIPFCTITFNQYGQFIGISFGNRAPRRSMEQEDGFTYTVSGLDANTEYYFKMETMDEDNKLINTDEGAFRTTNDATGIENQYNTVIEHRKVMINGQIYIIRGDKIYTIQGQEVK